MEALKFLALLFINGCYGFLESPGHLSFIALGDWGGIPFFPFYTSVQTAVADAMTSVARRDHADFVITLGDNFYLAGVHDELDSRFQTTFENVYSDPSLHVPWYVVAGNHDYYGNVSAQIEYSKHSNRWNYPDYYQKVSKHVPGGDTLDVFLIDTIQLCGNVFEAHVQPAGPADNATAEAQWAWLEQQLQQSTADFIIVGGHFPVYSIGTHGPTNCLINRLQPLLDKYNVTAYLSGHDHNLQHIQIDGANGKTMNQFVIGSGNFVDSGVSSSNGVPADAVKFVAAELLDFGGFGYFQVTDHTLKMQFIDGVGKVQYEYTMQPRK